MKYTALLLAALALGGCGYHVSGHADMLPSTVKTIAIPAVGNSTSRYKLSDHLAASLTREFISRTRYRIVADPNQADAILQTAVTRYYSTPVVVSPASRATTVQLSAFLQVNLYERATGKVLFTRPNMEVRQRYEISQNPLEYFEESDIALDRASREVARSVVSAILEAF
jgi:outer membrane lipopolysaccharide assembly protein LptE/RlpB